MNERQIIASINQLVGPLLKAHGFSNIGSSKGTWYRNVCNELSHFVMFDIFQHKKAFDIKVFPSTSRFGNTYWEDFPNKVGIPSGSKAGLNAKLGVGHGASIFGCVNEVALTAAIQSAVLPALENFAIPYLSQFQAVGDIEPILEHPQWAALLK